MLHKIMGDKLHLLSWEVDFFGMKCTLITLHNLNMWTFGECRVDLVHRLWGQLGGELSRTWFKFKTQWNKQYANILTFNHCIKITKIKKTCSVNKKDAAGTLSKCEKNKLLSSVDSNHSLCSRIFRCECKEVVHFKVVIGN